MKKILLIILLICLIPTVNASGNFLEMPSDIYMYSPIPFTPSGVEELTFMKYFTEGSMTGNAMNMFNTNMGTICWQYQEQFDDNTVRETSFIGAATGSIYLPDGDGWYSVKETINWDTGTVKLEIWNAAGTKMDGSIDWNFGGAMTPTGNMEFFSNLGSALDDISFTAGIETFEGYTLGDPYYDGNSNLAGTIDDGNTGGYPPSDGTPPPPPAANFFVLGATMSEIQVANSGLETIKMSRYFIGNSENYLNSVGLGFYFNGTHLIINRGTGTGSIPLNLNTWYDLLIKINWDSQTAKLYIGENGDNLEWTDFAGNPTTEGWTFSGGALDNYYSDVIGSEYFSSYQHYDPAWGGTIEDSSSGIPEHVYVEPTIPFMPFNSTWNTAYTSIGSSSSNQLRLPLTSSGTYNFTVDWGDGSESQITTWNVGNTHTYATPGVYDISILGEIEGWNLGAFNGDNQKLLEVSNWGDLKLGNAGNYFYEGSYMTITATDILDISGTTNMAYAFGWTTAFTQDVLSEWDVSHVTNMDSMFLGSSFNGDISAWDTSSVTNMDYMFADRFSYYNLFNGDISNWDTSSVTSMLNMFWGNSVFDQDISNWDVSGVTDFRGFLSGGVLSTENYDALLNRWSSLPTLSANEAFDAGSSQYSYLAVGARNILINTYGWTITDGGMVSPPPLTVNFTIDGNQINYTTLDFVTPQNPPSFVDEMNDYLSTCVESVVPGYCAVPLTFETVGWGNLTVDELSIDYSLNGFDVILSNEGLENTTLNTIYATSTTGDVCEFIPTITTLDVGDFFTVSSSVCSIACNNFLSLRATTTCGTSDEFTGTPNGC